MFPGNQQYFIGGPNWTSSSPMDCAMMLSTKLQINDNSTRLGKKKIIKVIFGEFKKDLMIFQQMLFILTENSAKLEKYH